MSCCGVFIMPVELTEPQGAMASAPEREFRLTGAHVLAMFVGFFAIVASVNAIMLTKAIGTMPGLDARNGYDISQNWNKSLEAKKARAELGWTVEGDVAAVEGGARIVVLIAAKEGGVVRDALVTAKLLHPSDRKRDVAVNLTPDGQGRYFGSAQAVGSGAWDIVIEARNAPGAPLAFLSRQRLVLKG